MHAIGIVAHTSRGSQARALQRQVGAAFVSIDNGVMGCDGNHRAVQRHLSALPTEWSVILEDDAVPVQGFREQVTASLTKAPAPIVSFYLGRQRPPHWQNRIRRAIAHADGASWICATHLLHAVGYAIRTDLLASLLDYDSPLPIDQHIGRWARHHHHAIAYTLPSLVEHADTPTIVSHPDGQPRTPGRRAWTVGTRQHWTTKAVDL